MTYKTFKTFYLNAKSSFATSKFYKIKQIVKDIA